MVQIRAQVRIAATPEEVWPRITDHEGMPSWMPLRSVTLEREGAPDRDGIGARRVMRAAGPPIVEEVVAWDPPQSYEYTLVRGAPIRDHLGRVELVSRGDDTEVTWSVRFQPRIPGTGWLIGKLLGAALQRSLDKLRDRFRA